MNNKGFAASGILYTLLLIFLSLMMMALFNFESKKNILDKIKDEVIIEEGSIGNDIVNTGATMVSPKLNDTHKGIIYLDPTNLSTNCNEELASQNVNSNGTPTEIKTGCMKWYVFGETNGKYKLILDHNTTARIKWNDSNVNVAYENSNLKAVVDDLVTTSKWKVTPRLITAEEVVSITGKTGFDVNNTGSWYYFDTNSQTIGSFTTQNRSRYDWLYNNLNKCKTDSTDYGCSIEDNNLYTLLGESDENTWSYWTSTPVGTAGSGTNVWRIHRLNNLNNQVANDSGIGIRPVIEIPKTFFNESYEFDYTGSEQEFTAPKTGVYRIEVWGAQGGTAAAGAGGYGGYSAGNVYLTQDSKLYINVGGQGVTASNSSTYTSSSYNGGGLANYNAGSGGGATSVATVSGILSSLSENKSKILIVAGGGGGSGAFYTTDYNILLGGCGGGYKGCNGVDLNTDCLGGGKGGNQSAGGAAGTSIRDMNGTAGTFGKGGDGRYEANYSQGSGAGGGGYYGGGGGSDRNGSGGGGSGYVGSSKLISGNGTTKHMTCYNCSESDTASTKTLSSACHSGSAEPDCAKEGNGYIVITFVEERYDFNYTGGEQEFTAPKKGFYKVEIWGAQGGAAASGAGGYGSYSTGNVYLEENSKLYVNVGGKGVTASNSSTFTSSSYNGGGLANYNAGSGGGATHIATSSGILSSLSSKKDDILIVAGGGGGSGAYVSPSSDTNILLGGCGGGYKGCDGANLSSTHKGGGKGGTQSAGGAAGSGSTAGTSGAFGSGGKGGYESSFSHGSGAGGGGYYGGGGGSARNGAGAGGSGYINSLDLISTASDKKHMTCYNCTTSSSESTKTISNTCHSSELQSDCSKEGNGYVSITYIGTGVEIENNTTYEFSYTGSEQKIKLFADGFYKLEVWGAQGGTYSSYTGGYGGYSVGVINISEPDTLYINVGGAGSCKSGSAGYQGCSSAAKATGGYNGGGYSQPCDYTSACSGGGATHIAKRTGLLSTLSSYNSDVLIVAGGGGGGGYNSYYSKGNSGGAGGGAFGTSSSTLSSNFGQAGNGGGYSAGGGGGYYGGNGSVSFVSANTPKSGGGSGWIGSNNLYNKYMVCYGCSTSNDISSRTISNTCHSSTATQDCSKDSSGYAKITYLGKNPTFEYSYTGSVQSFVAPKAGKYKIESWGASGTGSAYGAYTKGEIELEEDDKLYLYIGKSTTSTANSKVFNNGTGDGGGWNGGGSTDIRLTNGDWDNFNSLKSRIMVAGAGGTTNSGVAGAAGGLTGYSGNGTVGGTQTSFGAVQSSSYTASSFGIANGGCTGGNGYYPGGGAACASGSGGGSSFISGYSGCNAISSSSTSSSITHTGSPNHYSDKVFTNAVMIDGKGCDWSTGSATNCGINQPQPDGTMAVGRSGNGYAKITYLGSN